MLLAQLDMFPHPFRHFVTPSPFRHMAEQGRLLASWCNNKKPPLLGIVQWGSGDMRLLWQPHALVVEGAIEPPPRGLYQEGPSRTSSELLNGPVVLFFDQRARRMATYRRMALASRSVT